MNLKRKITLIVLLNLLPQGTGLLGDEGLKIWGSVKEIISGKPIPYALISVGGKGTYSDENGRYSISGLSPGSYLLKVQRYGYKTYFEEIALRESKEVEIFLEEAVLILPPITVKEKSLPSPDPIDRIKLSEFSESEVVASSDLLKGISNTALARPGSWGVKPILQGLPVNRVVVIAEGARVSESCPMGMDACLASISPVQMIETEVVQGPNTFAYGTGNLGGLIRLETPYPKGEDIVGNITLGWHSVNAGKVLNFKTSHKRGSFAYFFGTSIRSFKDYNTPKGRLSFSRFSNEAMNAKIWYELGKLRSSVSYQYYLGKNIGWAATKSVIPRERTSRS